MRSLPGFAFADRTALFDALVDSVVEDDVIRLSAGGRSAWLLSEPGVVRAALLSGAVRKGRPPASARGVGGYGVLGGDRIAVARADVMAALRKSALDKAGLVACQAHHDTRYALVAHLAGELPGGRFTDDLVELFAALTANPHVEPGVRATVADQLGTVVTSASAFVGELTVRGWGRAAIAAEILALTFAGWASLAAVIQSASTLGATGPRTTAPIVSEVLRVAPPAWLISRECVEPLDLPTGQIPVGGLVLTSPWSLHRDNRGWSHPSSFDPHRRGIRRSPWYMPFGVGRRHCPAELYSRAFLLVALSRMPESPLARCTAPALLGGRSACLLPA